MEGLRKALEEDNLMVNMGDHWMGSEADMDADLADLSVELVQEYLQGMERAIIDKDAVVTREDAEAVIKQMREEVAFDKMMIAFVEEVAGWPPSDCVELVMNTRMLNWVRRVHQQYQRLKIYTSAKKDVLRQLNGRRVARMYGVPIKIDETVTEPRLE